MDISAEIAAIQAASQGSELRQPLVGALNKLNSGSLPVVNASDAGKILKVGANGWEVGEKSGYMPVPTATMQITDNDTYDVTNYASAVVNVSGGGGGGTQNPFIVDASSTYSGASLSAQNAFGINTSNYWGSNGATSDWLRMHFLEPVSISKVSFTNTYISGNLHWSSQRIVFQYSDDNNVWNDLFDKANLSDSTSNLFEETIQNSGEHLYYRFLCYRSSSYYAGIGKVVVNVSNIGSTLIAKTITQNGTYDPTDDNADGYSEVTVNVNSGGYPPINAIVNGQIGVFQIESIVINENISAYGSYLETDSASVIKFMQNYARIKFGNTKGTGGTSSSYGTIAERVALTSAMLNSVQDFVSEFPVLWSAEYVGNVYGNTSMISDLGLVLLGDFSAGGLDSGNQLLNSIDNYSAVILNGIYQKNPSANYNTSMMYPNPNLNQAYWTGMKDRNSSYNCNVTFTDETHVSLSGNKQVIIYGIP